MPTDFFSGKPYELQNLTRVSKVNILLVSITIVIAITPDFNLFFPKHILIGLIIFWYLDIFFREKLKIQTRIKKFIITILAWFSYELIVRAIGLGHADIGNYFNRLLYFDIVIKSIYVGKNYTHLQKKFLFRFIQCIVLLNLLYILIVSNQFPEIYFSQSIDREETLGFNRPTAVFYNMLSFFIGLCCLDYLKNNYKLVKSLDLLCLIMCYVFMLTCEPRATSLTFSVLLLLGSLYAFNRLDSKAILMIILCIPLVLLVIYILRDNLIGLLPERIAIRYLAIFGDAGGDEATLGRIPLMMNSLSSFASNPVFGIGNYIGKEYYHLIGQHAFFQDFLAAYGLIGFCFLAYYFPNLYYLIRKNIKTIYLKKYWLFAFWIYILFSLNSNTFYAQLAVSSFLMLSCGETENS